MKDMGRADDRRRIRLVKRFMSEILRFAQDDNALSFANAREEEGLNDRASWGAAVLRPYMILPGWPVFYWGVRVMSSKAMEKPVLAAFLPMTVNLKE